jgi:membrane associated rhomboid family serine protease
VIDARRTVGVTSTATSPVTIAIIVLNVAIYLIGRLSPDFGDRMFVEFSQWKPGIESGEWYRAFTAMFLHGSITHILFNMWALYIFGPVLERRFGAYSFLSLYFAGGLAGSALYYVAGSNAPAVGASGAIFGLFGAMLAASYRQRYTPAGRAVFGQLGLLLAINMALPLFVPRIAWQAHLGGLVAGVLIALAWDRLPLHAPGAARNRVLVALGVAVAALLIVILG